jgi:hypothetical protein
VAPPPSDPAALETAFLAIRRQDARLADLFLEALAQEETIVIDNLLVADSTMIQQAQGAANMIRALRFRLQQADVILAANARHTAAHKKGHPL